METSDYGTAPPITVLDDELPASASVPVGVNPLPPIAYPDGSVSVQGAVPFDPLGSQRVQALEEVLPVTTQKAQVEALKRRQRLIPKFTTLEAMYAEHPRLMSLGRLRVERLEPKFFPDQMGQRVPVSGIISMSAQPMSTMDFARHFGGFRFRVYGTLEQSNAEIDGGPPQPIDVAVAEFHLPLAPNMQNLPIAEASLTMTYGYGGPPYVGGGFGGGGGGFGGGGYPPYAAPRQGWEAPAAPSYGTPGLDSVFNFASNVMERGVGPTAAVPPQAWDAVSNMYQGSQTTLAQMAAQHAQTLQAQLEDERRRAADERAFAISQAQTNANRPSELRDAVEALSVLTSAQRGSADSDVIRQMRDDHERQLRFTREESDRRIQSKDQEAHRWVEQVRADAERQIQMAESRLRVAEEMLRNRDAEYRRELESREARAEQYLQARLTEKEREAERRVADVMASHDREVRMFGQMQDHSLRTTEAAHGIEMRSVQTDLAKLSAELHEKASRLTEHERKANRPLLEQVAENLDLNEKLQQLAGGPADGDGGAPESKWYESPVVASIAKVAIERGSDLIPKLTALVKKSESAAAATASVPAQVALPPGPLQMQGLPARRQYRMVFQDSDGPPVGSSSSAESIGARLRQHRLGDDEDASTNMHAVGPRQFTLPDDRRSASAQRPRAQAPVAAVPMAPSIPPAPPPPPMSVPPPAPAPPAPPAAPVASATSQEPDLSDFHKFGLDPAFVQGALIQLETYLAQGASPQQVVNEMQATMPAANIRQIPAALPIEPFVETIRSCAATQAMQLATGKGKRFLYALWKAMSALPDEPPVPTAASAPVPTPPASSPPASPPVSPAASVSEPTDSGPSNQSDAPQSDPKPVFSDSSEDDY